MTNSRYIIAFVSLLVLLMSITWTEDARADASNRMTVFTIDQPVQTPGNVILPAGSPEQLRGLVLSWPHDPLGIPDNLD
jgi:hypothetical protein